MGLVNAICFVIASVAVIIFTIWITLKLENDEDIVFYITKIILITLVAVSTILWICTTIKLGTFISKDLTFEILGLDIIISILMCIIWIGYFKNRYKKLKASFKYKYSIMRLTQKISGLQMIIILNFVVLPLINVTDIYYVIILVCYN
jgi:hypothetical protein